MNSVSFMCLAFVDIDYMDKQCFWKQFITSFSSNSNVSEAYCLKSHDQGCMTEYVCTFIFIYDL